MRRYFLQLAIFILGLSPLHSCDRFLAVQPPHNQWTTIDLFANDALAKAALDGIYAEFATNRTGNFASGGNGSVTVLLGLAADELAYNGHEHQLADIFSNQVSPDMPANLNLWASLYKAVFRANEIIEGVSASSALSTALAAQLLGEAHFIRAFSHFYLFNIYGAVPLAMTTDYRVTRSLPRAEGEEVYGKIMQDLEEAYRLLPRDYALSGMERVRPIRWAALALMARVRLYRGEWDLAAAAATEVIGQRDLYGLERDPGRSFLKNNDEAVWQLMPTSTIYDTWEGQEAIPVIGGAAAPVYSLSEPLLSAFGASDRRKAQWVGWYAPIGGSRTFSYPYKYKVKRMQPGDGHREYSSILRLSEQYLIRAEARIHLGDLAGSLADVNSVREAHGGLALEMPSDTGGLRSALVNERFVEFFHEWGHRWLDLKRWGTADAVIADFKPGWSPHSLYFPIPRKELEANPSLHQNKGY